MQRRNQTVMTLGIMTLIASAGMAVAQTQTRQQQQQGQQQRQQWQQQQGGQFQGGQQQQPWHAVQLAERISDKSTTLCTAIETAERHVSGVAVGIRVSMNSAPFQTMDGREGQSQYQPVRPITPVGERGLHDQNRPGTDRPMTERRDLDRQDENLPGADRREAERRDNERRDAERRDTEGQKPNRPLTDPKNDQPGQSGTGSGQGQSGTGTGRSVTVTDGGQSGTGTTQRGTVTGTGTGTGTGQFGTGRDQPGTGANRSGQTAQERRYATDSLFAIVTCVVDRSKVREVIVDLRDNSVLGVHSLPAFQAMSEHNGQGSAGYESDRGWMNDQGRSSSMVRASELMNATARNSDGRIVGDIDELAIDPDANRVVYGVLRRGGFLGMGESRYAIATTELTAPRDGRIHLNLHEADFEGQSGFDNQNWPKGPDMQWSAVPTPTGPTAAKAPNRIVKASNIIGTKVNGRDGKEIGEIKDLVVEPSTGRIVYVLMGTDRGICPVPMASLQRNGDLYTLPMTIEELRDKPVIDLDRDPDWNDLRWSRRIHQNYGVREGSEMVDRTKSQDGR